MVILHYQERKTTEKSTYTILFFSGRERGRDPAPDKRGGRGEQGPEYSFGLRGDTLERDYHVGATEEGKKTQALSPEGGQDKGHRPR